jgi:adenine-specific DNA-methyltransferase
MYATFIPAHSSTAAPLIQPDHHPKPILGDVRTKPGFAQAATKDRPVGRDGLNHPSIFVVRRPNISTINVESSRKPRLSCVVHLAKKKSWGAVVGHGAELTLPTHKQITKKTSMARLEDKIAEIKDPELRGAIANEVKALKVQKQFGLVFEQHQPEVVRVFRVPVRAGLTVAKKAGSLTETWRVVRVRDGMAELVKDADDSREGAPVDSLTVVRRMGQAIHPALVSVDQVQNGDPGQPHHILIEADNYHALQLLDYLYTGKVDCIYIDPPYNTGARDWKYNNNYIDSNDGWRHSKWLTFMQKRLQLAKRLLNPQTGVLIVTIDEHEVHHLGCLLEELFPDFYRQMVTIVVNPKGVTQGRFSRVEEYALFCFANGAFVKGLRDDLLTPEAAGSNSHKIPRWKGLLRSGTNARRQDRHKMFFPVLIDTDRNAVVGAGDFLPLDKMPGLEAKIDGYAAAWPIRTDGSLGNWGVGPTSLRQLIDKGYVSLGGFDAKRKTWGISYLSKKLQKQIETGAIQVIEFDKVRNSVTVEYAEARERQIKTVWHRSTHDAGAYGADILKAVFGEGRKFSFPKSLYAVRDAIVSVVRDKPNALIADFFAGSGTTLNAVNLLNATDGGQRQCILVTNNEVSEEEARSMTAQGLQPGDEAWDAVGICRSVTWPRNKFTILGQRDDGTALSGEYSTGRTASKEKPRTIRQLGFAEGRTLSLAQRKQLVALVPALPQSKLVADAPWFLDEDSPVSVLWDVQQAEAWLEALAEAEHLTDILVVTTESKLFNALTKEIKETLEPLIVEEDEKRPMAAGFAANLAYFKLDFLEPAEVAMGRQFAAILPMLWMMAGAKGSCPDTPDPHVHWLIPEGCPFAVLMREGRFREFLAKIEGRADLTHVFLATNSDSAFHDMQDDFPERIEVVQLYKNYLDNFKINTQRR